MIRGFWVQISVIFAYQLLALPAISETRVAMVIGNSNYQHASQLSNPRNDAEAVANALQELGFDVFQGTDLTLSGFDQILRKFTQSLTSADVALVFYAGHGAQVDGTNYLIPVDATLDNVSDLTQRAVSLRQIREVMERRPRINLLFFDACRNDPFLLKLSKKPRANSRALTPGWANVAPARGTYISFASAEGETASDGEGNNSPFTKSLLKHIGTQGKDVQLMMRDVRQEVIDATNGSQVPWERSSLTSQFAFKNTTVQETEPELNLTAAKTSYQKGEPITLTITPPMDCRLTLINVDAGGKSCLLFPHPKLEDAIIKGGETLTFPPRGALRLNEVGEETFVAMCNASETALTEARRDTRAIDCSKGAADRSFNDKVLETVTFDLDDDGEQNRQQQEPQRVLRGSLTVTVTE